MQVRKTLSSSTKTRPRISGPDISKMSNRSSKYAKYCRFKKF